MPKAQNTSKPTSWILVKFSSPDGLIQFTLMCSVVFALGLVSLKLYAYIISDSLALFSTLLDSILDSGISVANFFAARTAARPACAHYRFGHGKVESLAVLGQAAFIAGSAIFLIISALHRLYHPEPILDVGVGIWAVSISMGLTALFLTFQRHVIGITKSTLVSVDYLHYVMDLLLGAGVIASLVLGKWLHTDFLDPLFAFAIAGYILFSTWKLFKKSVAILMDREFREEKRAIIKGLISSHKRVLGFHELRTRSSGKKDFIQFHLELPDHLPLIEAHEITDEVEKSIQEKFPHAEILIHQDPISLIIKGECPHKDRGFKKPT